MTRTGAHARRGQDPRRTLLGCYVQNDDRALRRKSAAGGDVLLLARPWRRARRGASSLDGAGCSRLTPAPATIGCTRPGWRAGPDSGSSMLGARASAVLRSRRYRGQRRRKAKGELPAPISPLALEAVRRVDRLFEIDTRHQRPEQRGAPRGWPGTECAVGAPIFEAWMRAEQTQALARRRSGRGHRFYMFEALACLHALPRRRRVCLSNNAAERGLRGIALGRESVAAAPAPIVAVDARRRHVQPYRHGQGERHRPAGLARRRPRTPSTVISRRGSTSCCLGIGGLPRANARRAT